MAIHLLIVELKRNEPGTQVVVSVARRVPVTVSGTAVPGLVSKTAAAIDPVRALRRNPNYN